MSDRPTLPLFVFTRDGDVDVFVDISDAEGYMEAMDVLDGEYEDLFSVDGERLTVTAVDHVSPVVIERTGEHDHAFLARRVAVLGERNGYDGSDPDLRSVANAILANRWKVRWPRWPRWLDRRWHGDGPPTV